MRKVYKESKYSNITMSENLKLRSFPNDEEREKNILKVITPEDTGYLGAMRHADALIRGEN